MLAGMTHTPEPDRYANSPDELYADLYADLELDPTPPADDDFDPRNAYLSLDRIAAAVRRAGFPCTVEHTGGGCATVLAGTRDHAEENATGEYTASLVMAGPGWFEGAGYSDGRAYPDDLGIGEDGDSAATEREAVALIVAKLGGAR